MKYQGCKTADKYAQHVVGGKIIANKWVTLACHRHLDDLEKAKEPDYPFYFDSAAAEKAIKFVELMPHTKGEWAAKGLTLKLEPWQLFFIASVFGWLKKKNKKRKYRRAQLWVPRKNGKSALAAAIGNYMLCADGEYGAEIYSGATTEKQALEVFKPAKLMLKKCPDLTELAGVDINASNLSIVSTGAKFEPIVGDPGDGSSPHCAIVDEYHEHKDDRMVDTMETGMGAREQPLLLMITTAGSNLSGPCYAAQLDAQKMLDGARDDDSTFAMIFGIDPDDKWDSVKAMKKANPNFGVSINEDFLRSQLNAAKSTPRKQSTYQTKHLNVWVGSKNAFFNIDKWNKCGSDDLSIEDYKGRPAYIGLDLSSKVDIAALEILIPDGDDSFIHFSKHYLPYDTAQQEHYIGWMREGWLTVTDGEIIDYSEIEADILELASFFEIQELAYDPFQATMLITRLMDQGVPVVEMRPTVLNFSEPMKELDSIIRSGKITHANNPCFRWMLSNVTAQLDKKDNVYPNKERPENKIDGPVALLMALGRALNDDGINLNYVIDNLMSIKL